MDLFVFIGALVTVVGTLATAIMMFYNSKRGVTAEVIKNYEVLDKQNKAQLEEWKDRTKKCEELHRQSIEKMGNMQGQLDTTLMILKDRNPEMIEFMKQSLATAARAEQYMQEQAEERKQQGMVLQRLLENDGTQTQVLKGIADFMKGMASGAAITHSLPQ